MLESGASIQVRAAASDQVIAAVTRTLVQRGMMAGDVVAGQALLRATGPMAGLEASADEERILVSGAGTGWISVFAEMDSDTSDLAEAVSGVLDAPTFWLRVDDGLVLRVVQWHGTEVMSAYESCAGFYDEPLLLADPSVGNRGCAEAMLAALGPLGDPDSHDSEAESAQAASSGPSVTSPASAGTVAPACDGPEADKLAAVLDGLRVDDIDALEPDAGGAVEEAVARMALIMGWAHAGLSFAELISGELGDLPGGSDFTLLSFHAPGAARKLGRRLFG